MKNLSLGSRQEKKKIAQSQNESAREALTLDYNGTHPRPNDERTYVDYSEEAIPERDPAYCPFGGTLHEEQTVDELPADLRLALARQLEQLGMSASRAAMVSRL